MITFLVKALSFAYAAEARKLNKVVNKLSLQASNKCLKAVRLAKESDDARLEALALNAQALHTVDRVAFHSAKAEQVKAAFLGETE